MFRKGDRISEKPPYSFEGGMHLRSFELESLEDGMDAEIYVDNRDRLCAEIRASDRKIKSPLKLPALYATYLRLLVDSQFIPINARILEKKEGWRVRILVGNGN